MSNKWAFETLNQISPLSSFETSPANGTADDAQRSEFSLSFPVSGSALQQQLEQWTNVSFDFDQSPPSADFSLPPLDSKDLAEKRVYEAALGAATASGVAPPSSAVNPDLTLPSSIAPFSFDSTAQGSLAVDPYLSDLLQPTAIEQSQQGSDVIPPAATLAYGAQPTSPASSATLTPQASTSGSSKRGPAKNRKPSKIQADPTQPLSEEQLNQLAIEEDKRRRNTAASARFRIKKKQREAALESTAKELRDKVSDLEKEVESLRTENNWLRSLVVDTAQREALLAGDAKRAAGSTLESVSKRARVEDDGEQGPERERTASPVKAEPVA